GLILANVRTPEERRGDLRAQLAACAAGRDGWIALITRLGRERADAAAHALLDYTSRRARAAVAALGDRRGKATDRLEGDGVTDADIAVSVAAEIRGDTLHLDFA